MINCVRVCAILKIGELRIGGPGPDPPGVPRDPYTPSLYKLREYIHKHVRRTHLRQWYTQNANWGASGPGSLPYELEWQSRPIEPRRESPGGGRSGPGGLFSVQKWLLRSIEPRLFSLYSRLSFFLHFLMFYILIDFTSKSNSKIYESNLNFFWMIYLCVN